MQLNKQQLEKKTYPIPSKKIILQFHTARITHSQWCFLDLTNVIDFRRDAFGFVDFNKFLPWKLHKQ